MKRSGSPPKRLHCRRRVSSQQRPLEQQNNHGAPNGALSRADAEQKPSSTTDLSDKRATNPAEPRTSPAPQPSTTTSTDAETQGAHVACRSYSMEDVSRVIALEQEYLKKGCDVPIVLLRFPDPELNCDIVRNYSADIEAVHFQQNSGPRYCFVNLKANADVPATIEALSKIPFGTGFISAELKRVPPFAALPANPEGLDPYTLYIGNLPRTIATKKIKEHFPGARRIDIGYAQRMKKTRYAFVRYDSVDAAMTAFKRLVNTVIESRSLIVRFKRNRSAGGSDSCTSNAAPANSSPEHSAETAAYEKPSSSCAESVVIAHSTAEKASDEPDGVNSSCRRRNSSEVRATRSTQSMRHRHSTEVQVLTAQSVLPVRIKEEASDAADAAVEACSRENAVAVVKTEPADEPAIEDFEYNAELNMCYTDLTPSSMQIPECTDSRWNVVDEKPNIKQLSSLVGATKRRSSETVTSSEHMSFIRKLHHQMRRARQSEVIRRPRDELDDVFAQMNSDSEEDGPGFI